jgi:hypothetical protein
LLLFTLPAQCGTIPPDGKERFMDALLLTIIGLTSVGLLGLVYLVFTRQRVTNSQPMEFYTAPNELGKAEEFIQRLGGDTVVGDQHGSPREADTGNLVTSRR